MHLKIIFNSTFPITYSIIKDRGSFVLTQKPMIDPAPITPILLITTCNNIIIIANIKAVEKNLMVK
jgi:hypothetical protein